MKKISTFLVIMLFIALIPSGNLFCEKKTVLDGLNRPETLVVDKDKLFIIEGVEISILSTKNYKLLKKMGKEGEGPQEFKRMPALFISSIIVYPQKDQLFINNVGKVLYFDRDGNFKSEKKINLPFCRFAPVGKNYIGLSMERGDKGVVIATNLYDNKFERKKTLFQLPDFAPRGKKINPLKMALANKTLIYESTGDKVFVPTPQGEVHVFNEAGEKVYAINHDYPKFEVTKELKKKLHVFFMNDYRFKRNYEQDHSQNNIQFPDHLPVLQELRVTKDRVYVVSFFTDKKDHHLTFIFDTKDGTFIKKQYLPIRSANLFEVYPFTIGNGSVYQTIENEADEEWELFVEKID